MPLRPINHYCSVCAAALTRKIPPGDQHERDCCDACGAIHYVNPRPVVGTIPVWQSQVLLCRRAIEPRHGFWTLPAGFMEVGESTAEGALRETREEAGARIQMGPLFSVFDVPQAQQVHLFFRAQILDLNFDPGPESLEVALFSAQTVPWNKLAFQTVEAALRYFFSDQAKDSFGMHYETLRHPATRP